MIIISHDFAAFYIAVLAACLFFICDLAKSNMHYKKLQRIHRDNKIAYAKILDIIDFPVERGPIAVYTPNIKIQMGEYNVYWFKYFIACKETGQLFEVAFTWDKPNEISHLKFIRKLTEAEIFHFSEVKLGY